MPSLEDLRREALARGARLEVGGRVFNQDAARVPVKQREKPEAPPAPTPPPPDPVPNLLADLNRTLAGLAAAQATRPDGHELADAIARAVASSMPEPAPAPAPRPPVTYDFEVVERDERGYIKRGRLTPR